MTALLQARWISWQARWASTARAVGREPDRAPDHHRPRAGRLPRVRPLAASGLPELSGASCGLRANARLGLTHCPPSWGLTVDNATFINYDRPRDERPSPASAKPAGPGDSFQGTTLSATAAPRRRFSGTKVGRELSTAACAGGGNVTRTCSPTSTAPFAEQPFCAGCHVAQAAGCSPAPRRLPRLLPRRSDTTARCASHRTALWLQASKPRPPVALAPPRPSASRTATRTASMCARAMHRT